MRKTTTITITDDGNDLKFMITQMPATKLYDFIGRAVTLLADTELSLGEGGLLEAGSYLQRKGLSLLRGLDYAKAKPLLDELLSCCERLTGDGVRQHCTPDILDGFVSSPVTIFKLQLEAAKLNFDFFLPLLAGLTSSPGETSGGQPENNEA